MSERKWKTIAWILIVSVFFNVLPLKHLYANARKSADVSYAKHEVHTKSNAVEEKATDSNSKSPRLKEKRKTPSNAILYKDGFHYIKGSGQILYCMNNTLNWPHYTQAMGASKVPEYEEGYLTEDDFKSEEEYEEFLRRASNLLYAGYPYNGANLYEIVSDADQYIPTVKEFNEMLIPPAQLADAYPKLKHYEFGYPSSNEQIEVLREFYRSVQKMTADGITGNGLSKEAIEGMPFYKAALCLIWGTNGTPMEAFATFYGASYFVTKNQAYDATQLAFWKLLNDYGIKENDIDSLNGNALATEMLAFSEQGKVMTQKPDRGDLKLEGQIKFKYNPKDGFWHSEPLKLIEPEGYNGIYNLILPEGVRTLHNMKYVYGNEEYELVSDHLVGEYERFGIEGNFMYLKEFRQYSPSPDIEVNGKKFQHMAAAVLEKTTIKMYLGHESHEGYRLAVSMKLIGEERGQSFEFHLELPNHPISGRYGDMDFDEGYAVFYLKHGETKMAEHLPEGAEYRLTKVTNGEFDAVGTNEKGVIKKDQTITAEFTYTPLPELTMNKIVTGVNGDLSRSFTFIIELMDKTGKPVDGLYEYFGDVKSGYEKLVQKPEDGELYFTDGKAQVKLSHGQQITLKYLPYRSTYTITEAEADQEGYTTYYNEGKDPISGKLAEDVVVQVENHKEFMLEKPNKPSNPIENKPVKPEEEKPSNSIENKPVKPEEEKPSNPIENKPSKPEEEKPSNLTGGKPNKPSKERLSESFEDSPAKSSGRESGKTVETRMKIKDTIVSNNTGESIPVSGKEISSESVKKPFTSSPKTGEGEDMTIWLVIMAGSLFGFCICFWRWRKS